jgi:polar amino acid transport system permease protein
VSGPINDPEALTGSRRSHLFGEGAARSWTISIVSTVVVLGGLAWIIVNSPNWPATKQYFFDPEVFAATWPKVLSAFVINIKLFLVCEALILPFGLFVALLRLLPGPAFTPVRLLAVIYVDVMRGLPGILVIYLLGFGIPGLELPGVPIDEFFWGVVALTLLYSAYVSEVYRAGIESIHPSQDSAARSLGLSRTQSMRYVVVPQAVRRVIPPLLNDFIGLQKDTALVGFLGIVEAFNRANIESSAAFNSTPLVFAGILFLLITIPMARFVDWYVARSRRGKLGSVL